MQFGAGFDSFGQSEAIEIRHLKVDKSKREWFPCLVRIVKSMKRGDAAIYDRRQHSPADKNLLKYPPVRCVVIDNECTQSSKVFQFALGHYLGQVRSNFKWERDLKTASAARFTFDTDLSNHQRHQPR